MKSRWLQDCYRKKKVAIERKKLLWKGNGCYDKSQDAFESQWVLKKSMVAMKVGWEVTCCEIGYWLL
jgi:hypothetical protein